LPPRLEELDEDELGAEKERLGAGAGAEKERLGAGAGAEKDRLGAGVPWAVAGACRTAGAANCEFTRGAAWAAGAEYCRGAENEPALSRRQFGAGVAGVDRGVDGC
jgi:hypothetical protein